ncbi:PREDICTED: rho GTPase-activating protein 7-like, partial [Priapulus caudatus]|uniref:Rho GTPase-activating protein 7-like n=1 Tax=Priapulus caudatus TaxID=37621 RepID=A0ABM1F4U1_PRICU
QDFPIDVSSVGSDHDFLDEDSIQALYRRLNILNKCAKMRIDKLPVRQLEDSDEEDPCALSDRWKFQRHSRRWSRMPEVIDPSRLVAIHGSPVARQPITSCGSHDSVLTDGSEQSPLTPKRLTPSSQFSEDVTSVCSSPVLPHHAASPESPSRHPGKDSSGERIKEGARALLRRMGSFKTKKRVKGTKQDEQAVVISGPMLCDAEAMQEARDKFKGWMPVSTVAGSDGTELSFKKVADGHPLRLWKCSADVEAPPVELLNRVLRERHLWDDDFVKWKVVDKLDKRTEIFQYMESAMPPQPTREYCVLR